MSVVVKHITDPVPHILDINPALPTGIEAIIEKAMAKNRDERFTTASQLADALHAVASGETPDLKTIIATRRTAPAKTRISAHPTPTAPVAARQKKSTLPFILGGLAGMVCLAGIAGLYIFRNSLPFLQAQPTPSQVPGTMAQESPTIPPTSLTTPSSVVLTTAAPTDTLLPTPTATTSGPPLLGGADKIAFVKGGNIWIMNADGSELKGLTTDGTPKHDLQWLADGKRILYITGKCVEILNVDTGQVETLSCFNAAEYLEAFELSPDFSQVAISVSRELYVVPYDEQVLSQVKSYVQLAEMKSCLVYKIAFTKSVRWSSDGQKLAIVIIGVNGSKREDIIRVLDIHLCYTAEPIKMDEFPGARFTMSGFHDNPVINDFAWDGDSLFLLNSAKRNGGFGDLYSYNMESKKGLLLDPVDNNCCYRDARWSPDGRYIFFAFQDIRLGSKSQIELYYLPYVLLGTGAEIKPLPLPFQFFTRPDESPQAALRPAQ